MIVIGYARVSTREQALEGYSLGEQRKAIEVECDRRGWTLAEVIEDAGYTGTNDNRPGLQRALKMLAKRNGPKAIVVARLDRLARSTQNLCEYIVLCKRQKWSMVALDQHLDTTTANGRLLVRVLASVAEWESEVNSERTRVAMLEAHVQARANGKVLGFQRRVDDATVARIVRARNKGQPYNKIAARLDRTNTPTPNGGKRWYPATVARIYQSATKVAS